MPTPASPTVTVRAPGRVNLIGEHTDYSNLPVLPIAIDRSLTVSATPTDDGRVEAVSELFPGAVQIERARPAAARGWGAYIAGAIAELADVAPGRGARVSVAGDLPAGGGLSSSSALSCAVIAALSAAWGAPLERAEVMRRAIAAERHTGVETGGMDQEVICFARSGHALHIDFDPAGHRDVPLPAGLAFVVAYSGEPGAKGDSARDAYNERVVGTRIAAAMLADQLGLDVTPLTRLGEIAGIDVIEVLVEELPEQISAKEAAHGLPVGVEGFGRLSHGRFDHTARVPVKRLARHVLSEAGRVEAAEAALAAGDLRALGALLNESHDSLRQDFRCSTAALDRVCAAMRRSGAFGARLTGAGFGGYALAACAPEQVEAVIEAAVAATGGPAFEVRASAGLAWL